MIMFFGIYLRLESAALLFYRCSHFGARILMCLFTVLDETFKNALASRSASLTAVLYATAYSEATLRTFTVGPPTVNFTKSSLGSSEPARPTGAPFLIRLALFLQETRDARRETRSRGPWLRLQPPPGFLRICMFISYRCLL
jgi:hypothetical protein